MAKSSIENKGLSGAAAVLIAIWSIGSLATFFAYRGADIGQLGKLLSNLGGGPLVGGDVLASFVGVVISILIFLAWCGTGRLILDLFQIETSVTVLRIATMSAVGAATWSLIFFFVGLTGGYYMSAAIIAVLVGMVPLAIRFGGAKDKAGEANFLGQLSVAEWSMVVLFAVVLVISLIAALAPPVAKDTLLYHFALPKAYIAQHSNAFVDGNIASYLALGNEMHSVWAMLLGRMFSPRAAEAAAGATSFLFFPLLLMITYGWAREAGIERRWSLLSVLMVVSIPTAFHVATSAYIDLGLALYVTLAMFALSSWWRGQQKSQLALVAIFLGAALSIKLTAVFVFAAFALIVLLRARSAKESGENQGKIIGAGLATLVLAAAIASPWYLRTWKATGSPVFPFYMSIWKGEAAGWDVERSNIFQAMNSQYGGENKGVVDYLLAPVKFSVMAQPEISAYYDGVIGVALLIGMPLLVWGLWKFDLPVEVNIGSGVAGIMFLFWLFSSQQLRYLLPIVPVLAISIVSSAEMISERFGNLFRSVVQLSFAAASVTALLVSLAWFLQAAPLRVVLGGETRDEYLTRNLDYYPYYSWLNTETTADSKVWLINMRRDTYNLDRPVFSDYLFEDWTLRSIIWESRSVHELRAKAAAMGVKYILTRHDFLFDYDRSTIVDDKKPRAENEAKLKMTKDFILDPVNMIKSDNKFSLIKVLSKE